MAFAGQREPLTLLDAGCHAKGPELWGDGSEQMRMITQKGISDGGGGVELQGRKGKRSQQFPRGVGHRGTWEQCAGDLKDRLERMAGVHEAQTCRGQVTST